MQPPGDLAQLCQEGASLKQSGRASVGSAKGLLPLHSCAHRQSKQTSVFYEVQTLMVFVQGTPGDCVSSNLHDSKNRQKREITPFFLQWGGCMWPSPGMLFGRENGLQC